jgi:hypothetical protein
MMVNIYVHCSTKRIQSFSEVLLFYLNQQQYACKALNNCVHILNGVAPKESNGGEGKIVAIGS